jgi:DNA-binding GntR family transcriptional regulator
MHLGPQREASVAVPEVLRDILHRGAVGEYGPKLPSIVTLSHDLGVSQMTVIRAIAILKDEGLLYSVPGLGTFVTER